MPPTPQAPTMIGRTVSHYRVLEKLGSGGMVYKAEDTKLKRLVALKFLPEELSRDQRALQRVLQEVGAASRLNHPNICTIYGSGICLNFLRPGDIDEVERERFIVMELLEGQSLRDFIAGQRLAAERIVELGIQIADGLEAAHARGIVHRDVKPANIFLTQSGQAKILDFGLGKFSPWMMQEKVVGGTALPIVALITSGRATTETLAYMSPEQVRGEELDVRSDLFSLGAVLYEMCTGRPAFTGSTSALIFDSILNRKPSSPLPLNSELLPRLEEIVSKALEKDRAARYQRASEIWADLNRLKRDSDSQGTVVSIATGLERRARAASRKEPAVLRIAVLPFENGGGDPETEFLSDGITESLIARLSQLPNLNVISRMSVFRYKGSAIDPVVVGRELTVGAILAGRMVPRGNSLSISVELIDTRDSSLIWGARHERNVADLSAVEEEIANNVADKLQVKLTGTERKHLTRRPTQNPGAYQLYLKGRYYWNKGSEEALQKSLEYFNLAIERDPGYALAYAGVADAYALLVWNIMLAPREGLPKSRAAATKALEIDSELAEAHSSLAFVKLFYDWDWQGAESEFRRTLDLNCDYPIARQWYAMELAALGRHEEAIRETERALQLDPFSMSINTTTALSFYMVRQYDLALAQCLETIELDARFPLAHFACGCAYEQMGKYKEALAEFQAAVNLSKRLPLFLSAWGHGCAVSGNSAEAQRVKNELCETYEERYRSSYCVAVIHAGLAEKDRALEWLERAYEERATWMIFLNVHPLFDPLRAEPRFQDLLKRLALAS